MNASQINTLLQSLNAGKRAEEWRLVETHISYVLLGRSLVYKFKKNIRYNFLDFSTIENRRHFCQREVKLNQRLTTGVYLAVVPVTQSGKDIQIDGKTGKIIDYAVKMKRLQSSKQMNLMMNHNLVTKQHMQALARLLRNFHNKADIISTDFEPAAFKERFNDLVSIRNFIQEKLPARYSKIIDRAIRNSNRFIEEQQAFFIQRVQDGFIRDCHGDLHARNIFLYARPIVFDCIEFNDAFRQIDILDEIAFFCMDLEESDLFKLSRAFINYYFSNSKKAFGKKERMLFTYYKSYRANVRAKVNALRAMQAKGAEQEKNLQEVKKYLELMMGYLDEIS